MHIVVIFVKNTETSLQCGLNTTATCDVCSHVINSGILSLPEAVVIVDIE